MTNQLRFGSDPIEKLTIQLWNIETKKLIKTLYEHEDIVRAVHYNCEDRLFASASDDKTIKIHDLNGSLKEPIHTLRYNHPVASVKFHPVNPNLFACAVHNGIKLYDARTFKVLQQYVPAHEQKVTQLDMSGQFLISSGDDGLKIWDLFDQFLCYTLRGHTGNHTSVIFGPGG
jgi:WD40 repeat protein